MRIHYFSDLHLERSFFDQKLPSGDVLLLAGDICEAKNFVNRQTEPDKQEKRDHIRWFFDQASEKFSHVLYCMGNHEHLDFDFLSTKDFLQDQLPDNIKLLEKDYVEIENTIFFGATLWSSFKKGNLDEMSQAAKRMPEYKYVYAGGQLLTTQITAQEHKLTLNALSDVARTYQNNPIIVMTHHAPSFEGISDKHRGNGIEGAFASDLEELIESFPNIRHWVFGHTHVKKRFRLGNCQVYSNCQGYRGLESTAENFDPDTYFTTDLGLADNLKNTA